MGLRSLRESKGYSTRGLGQLLGVTRKAVERWEHGLSAPRIGRIVPIARALGVSTEDILDAIAEVQGDGAFEVW